LDIKRKLTKIMRKPESPTTQAHDLLMILFGKVMTLELLTATKICPVVSNLKSSADSKVAALATSCVTKWKQLFTMKPKTNIQQKLRKAKLAMSCRASENVNPNDRKPMTPRLLVGDPKVRQKSAQLIAGALKVAYDESKGHLSPVHLAKIIEECVFAETKSTDNKYRIKIRSKVMNLKDQKNPELPSRVLTGKLSAVNFATMTTMQMASDELSDLRKELAKKAIKDRRFETGDQSGGSGSSLITCPECHKSNGSYQQMQTLSGDEPMTTFCTCNECGHRWKFF